MEEVGEEEAISLVVAEEVEDEKEEEEEEEDEKKKKPKKPTHLHRKGPWPGISLKKKVSKRPFENQDCHKDDNGFVYFGEQRYFLPKKDCKESRVISSIGPNFI